MALRTYCLWGFRWSRLSTMEHRLIQHGLVDSTSSRAFADLAAGTARHGDVHLARGQSAGRGREGHTWLSPTDEGLYASIVLLPDPPALRPTALTMACALATLESLRDLGLDPFGDGAAQLKWPNDIQVGGAKLCGILTESRSLAPARPHFVVGIGMNVRQLQFPAELKAERAVTSLALLGHKVTVAAATEALLGRLGGRLAQVRGHHRELADDYLLASGLGEQRVRVTCSGEERVGQLVGLSVSSGLELRGNGPRSEFLPLEFIQAVSRDELD